METASDPGPRGRPRAIAGFDVVRAALAVLLLTAAGLKGHQLATEPVAETDIFSYRWSLMLQVEFEIVLGLWLVSGLYRRLAWLAATVCFAFFCGVTLYKGLSGEASCGCFGRVQVSPWHTLVLDVAAVVSLLVFRPDLRRPAPASRHRLRLAGGSVLAMALGVPAGFAMMSYKPAAVGDDGMFRGAGSIVLLEPEKWVGKPFPLLAHIDVGQRLAAGSWIVMFFHHDCPDCGKAMPAYARMAEELEQGGASLSVAMVEVPPYGRRGGSHADGPHVTFGKLKPVKEWFVTTPAVAVVVDGQVRAAWEGKAPNLATILKRLAPTGA